MDTSLNQNIIQLLTKVKANNNLLSKSEATVFIRDLNKPYGELTIDILNNRQIVVEHLRDSIIENKNKLLGINDATLTSTEKKKQRGNV